MSTKYKEADLSKYEKVGEIGNGAYGNVIQVKNTSNDKFYAAKILKFNVTDEGDQKKNFERELHCHRTLDNPAVIKFIGYSPTDFEGNEFPVILTKYMENGCLQRVFSTLRSKKTYKGWNNTKMVINILGIALGMKYLHDSGIIHRDLKPPNVLLDKNLYPKLTDFGTSRHLEANEKDLTNLVGTPYYMAPEVSDAEKYSFSVDVFSFGMILYEFYTNSPPTVPGKTNYQIIRNIIKGSRPNNKKLPEGQVKDLIIRCWDKSPEERPTFDDIIGFFTKDREDYWPEDVDEEEVDKYLGKFGFSLDPDKIVQFFLKHPKRVHKDNVENGEEEDEEEGGEEGGGEENITDTPISLTTSIKELKSLLLETIESNDYIPEECIESELDEDDFLESLDEEDSDIYQQATKENDINSLMYISNQYRKGNDPFPEDKHLAYKYMKQAALLGSSDALYGLAYIIKPDFKNDTDKERAENFIDILKIAVEFGDARASYVFGFIYSIGFHVEKNFVLALVYLKYAADKKFPDAMLMYADRLRTIANEKIPQKNLTDLIKKATVILNDIEGYNTRSNKLRMTAQNLLQTIKQPSLADFVSRVYYQKVIDYPSSSKRQKIKAGKVLEKLSEHEIVEDYSDAVYSKLFQTIH